MRSLAIACIIAAVICEVALADIHMSAFLPMRPTAKPVVGKRSIASARIASIAPRSKPQAGIPLGQAHDSAPVHVGKNQPEKEESNHTAKLLSSGIEQAFTVTSDGQQSEPSSGFQIFQAGFDAYQLHNYPKAVACLSELLQKHPDTPLRDLALFWLARSQYQANNHQDAARNMVQFNREYPAHYLKNTVEDELLALAAKYN